MNEEQRRYNEEKLQKAQAAFEQMIEETKKASEDKDVKINQLQADFLNQSNLRIQSEQA
jgi:hypothetical protein